MNNLWSIRQQHGKSNAWVCISVIQRELVNHFDNKSQILELSSEQIAQEFSPYPISATVWHT